MITLDEWQQKIMDTNTNLCVRAARQTGKSTVISIKAGEFAVKNREKFVMIVASVERQAQLLFDKVLNYLMDNYKMKVCGGSHRPTKHKIELTNGSTIMCLPCGLNGNNLRGYTIDLLIIDECAYVPEPVFTSIIPSMAITRGKIWALSTPRGKDGYFFRCFEDPSFTNFHVTYEDCPRHDTNFIERERARLTKCEFAQEHLAEFVDELIQFFPSDLIRKCMILPKVLGAPDPLFFPSADIFAGVDVARLGEDDSVIISLAKSHKETRPLKMIDMEVISKVITTETAARIKIADKKFNYKRIYIDSIGVGAGVMDTLLWDNETKHRVTAIDNSKKSLERNDKFSRRLMKEDLYTNLLRLMEQGKIELFDDPEIYLSLSSVQYEYTDNAIKIFGRNTHICEALIRAAFCVIDKTIPLNIWAL